jgi:hypothetical protein
MSPHEAHCQRFPLPESRIKNTGFLVFFTGDRVIWVKEKTLFANSLSHLFTQDSGSRMDQSTVVRGTGEQTMFRQEDFE